MTPAEMLAAPLPDFADPSKDPLMPDNPLPAWAEARPTRLVASPAEADRVLVVDVSNLAWRSAFAHGGLKAPDGELSGGVFGALSELLAKVDKLPPGRLCIAFCYDGRGATAARRQILPNYKNRPHHETENPIPKVCAALKGVTGLHVECPEREADDAAAWIAGKCGDTPVVLLSNDKDFWGLISPTCAVLSPTKQRYVTVDDIYEEFSVKRPDQVYLAKSLFGDSTDKIVGVPRLQQKRIEPYFECGVRTPAEFYECLEQNAWKGLTAKAAQKIRDAAVAVANNYTVVVPWLDRFGAESVRREPGSSDAVSAVMTRYGIKMLLDRVGLLTGAEKMTTGAGYGAQPTAAEAR